MLQGEHSAIFSIFIKLPVVIKTFVLSFFEWPFYTGFTEFQQTNYKYSKTCVKQQLSIRPKIDFQDQLSLNTGQRYCRVLQGEHSAVYSTFIKLPVVIKTFVLSILSGHFTQVLLYFNKQITNTYTWLMLYPQSTIFQSCLDEFVSSLA